MPALYVPHGAGPCFFMDWDPPDEWTRLRGWLEGALATLPARPTAIVVVSAHWEQPAFAVQGAARPGMLFDYSGFPEQTYRLRYAPPGSAISARAHTRRACATSTGPAACSGSPADASPT